MHRVLILTLALFAPPLFADQHADPGVVVKKSTHSVAATLDKLEGIVKSKGFTVFVRVDHAAGAASVGQSLRPTQVLIFGNPTAGTKLMTASQGAGLDLPIRVAAWEDEDGQVWVSYNDPAWLAARHNIKGRDPVIKLMTGALAKFTDAATM